MSFCVKCGEEGVETVDGLCIRCFLDGRKLVVMPHHVDLIRCANCNEFMVADQWVRKNQDDAIIDIALSTAKLIPEARLISVGPMVERQDERTFVVHAQFDLDVGGIRVSDESSVIVRLKNGVCKRCSRQLGSYYESILQLRSGDMNLPVVLWDEVVRWVSRTVDDYAKNNRDLFITKIQKAIGGIDFYLSSTSMGKSLTKDLADRYGAEVKESSSLVGQTSDGQEMYRVTFLVRLPAYHVGDILHYNDKPYKLISVNKSGGRIMDLSTFRDMPIKRSELSDIRIMFKGSELSDAVVVSRSGDEIQVLHPRTYSTVDLRIPKGAEIGESVKVIEVEEELLFVP